MAKKTWEHCPICDVRIYQGKKNLYSCYMCGLFRKDVNGKLVKVCACDGESICKCKK